jgi:hypothetical protein
MRDLRPLPTARTRGLTAHPTKVPHASGMRHALNRPALHCKARNAPVRASTRPGGVPSSPRCSRFSSAKRAQAEELTSATGWLPHTTRVALTGLRKRGSTVLREGKSEGGSVYRIIGMTQARVA